MNLWRRFRDLPRRVQVVSWIVAAVVVFGGLGTALGDGTSGQTTADVSTATTTTVGPATTVPATTTTVPATTTTTAATTTTVPPTTTTVPATTTTSTTVARTTTTTTTTTSTTTTTTVPRTGGPGSALAGLATLPIKGRAPLTGYSRAQFGPAWSDSVSVEDGHNGCDTRDDILRRDLTNVVVKPGTHGCIVIRGVLHDPYTNTVITFSRGPGTSSFVQIDHVVALADAWQTGAQRLSLTVRKDFANDPLNLRAVSGAANQQKGDSDAASWLPPNRAFRCTYVATQVAVKIKYHLWVTRAEHDAIARVLSRCPTQRLPSSGPPVLPGPSTPTPTPTPPTPTPTTASPPATTSPSTGSGRVVHPGAYCSPAGARGVSTTGKPMICRATSTDPRARWRSAA